MYRGILMVCVLGGIGLAAAPLRGQSPPDQVQELQRQIHALQETLSRIESGPGEKTRVTQLGTSRIPVEEKEDVLVVRIYDLSDLFVVAPSYPATYPNNLEGETLVFPGSPSEYSGTMGMGGMGGMGAGGAGAARGKGGGSGGAPHGAGPRGGGMYNIEPPSARGRTLSPQILPQMLSAESCTGSPDAARMSMDDLIQAITRTISPQDWVEWGGRCAIAPLGNSLIISATRNIHQQIEALLAAFRKRWGTFRTVSVEAHWLWLTEEQLGRLLSESRQRASGGEKKIFGLIDDAPWNELRNELAQAGDEHPAGYQAVITGFNGQTVSTVSGGLKRYVIDMIPVVGQEMNAMVSAPSGPAVGYQPVTTTIQEGAALQVTPMVSTGGKYVTLDVQSRVLRVEERRAGPAAGPAAPVIASSVVQDLAGVIDRPRIVNYHLATTLRIPEGRRMLVGGMTFESDPEANQPNLYLFVKNQVQELRDEATEARPGSEKGVAERLPGRSEEEILMPSCNRIDYSHPQAYLFLNNHFGSRERIMKAAAQIKGTTPEEKLVAIHRWIESKLSYKADYFDEWRTFDQMLDDGLYGGCAQYSVVFGALARACGIPTVWVKTLDADWIRGFKTQGKEGSWNGHVFLEIFLHDHWVLLDDTQLVLYEGYDPKMRILPGNRYAYDKGGDPFDLVLSARWELWKKQTRAYLSDFDLSQLPVGKGIPLRPQAIARSEGVKYPAVFVFCSERNFESVSRLSSILYPKLTHHYTGRPHASKDYEEQFSKYAKPGNTIILILSADENEVVPEGFRDLLPKPWSEIEAEVGSQGAVKYEGTARKMNVITLVAKTPAELMSLIEKTPW